MNFEQFYKENYDMFIKRVYNRAGSIHNAEDIVQEAFAMALRFKDGFDPTRGSIIQWFSRILDNECKKFCAVERNHGMGESTEELVEVVEDPKIISKKFAQMVRKHKEQDVLELHFKQGYRPVEISDLTGRNVKTIHTIIDRFKKKAMEKLSNTDE